MACGDLIACMAGMKAVYERTGQKWLIYQTIGLPAMYYEGCIYGTHSETGVPVTMNETLFRMLRPLITAQEYIHDFRIYQLEKVDVDFDKMFTLGKCNKPFGIIQRWPFYAFHELAIDCDLSKPWISVPELEDGILKSNLNECILLNKTERYSHGLRYTFLGDSPYRGSVIFLGTKTELQRVISEHAITPGYLELENFLQAAQYLSCCKVFVGSQSFLYNLSEAMKIPRVVEVFPPAPNCIPIGKDGYDAMWQEGLECYVKHLFEK